MIGVLRRDLAGEQAASFDVEYLVDVGICTSAQSSSSTIGAGRELFLRDKGCSDILVGPSGDAHGE